MELQLLQLDIFSFFPGESNACPFIKHGLLICDRCLAPFQHMDYVCPALVAAAARKIYRHRIVISRPEDDRSILYGSTFKTARLLLTDATAENTIESVLSQVEVPM